MRYVIRKHRLFQSLTKELLLNNVNFNGLSWFSNYFFASPRKDCPFRTTESVFFWGLQHWNHSRNLNAPLDAFICGAWLGSQKC